MTKNQSNKVSAWTEEHERRLSSIMTELKDGVDGTKVTGKQVKSKDALFALLDSALLGRKIRQWRASTAGNGIKCYISICRFIFMKLLIENVHAMIAEGDDELKPLVIGSKRDFSSSSGISNQEVFSEFQNADQNTPMRIRRNGFQFDMRPFEIVWWSEGTRASVFLNITTNYSISATISSDGRNLVVEYTQRMIDPSFYIKDSAKLDILACPESRAILQYFEGKETETFTLSIPFSKKMLPSMEKRVIQSSKGKYPSVMVFILSVAPDVIYGDAESCESL
jgi:uncharacterized protein YbaR (Trm112 family)